MLRALLSDLAIADLGDIDNYVIARYELVPLLHEIVLKLEKLLLFLLAVHGGEILDLLLEQMIGPELLNDGHGLIDLLQGL